MTEFLVPSICGRTHLYGKHTDASVSSRIVTALTMHINADLLRKVLDEASARFPQFAVGLEVSEERYRFVALTASFPVFPVDGNEPAEFSDQRLHGCLIRVTYLHKSIFFDFHRSIADEAGMMIFVKSVLLRYLELSGYPVRTDGSVKLMSSEYVKTEGDDPMQRLENVNASRPVWYMDAKAMVPTVSEGFHEKTAQVRVPLSKLKKDSHDLTAIPVTYVAPLISHSIYEMYGDQMEVGEYVVAGVRVNLRPYYPSPSLRPYCAPVFLAYNRNLSDYPYNTVLMSQKKLLEAQLKNDTLAYSAQTLIEQVECADDPSMTLERVNEAYTEVQERLNRRSTYDICRIGNLILPESMQRLVTELYPVIPAAGRVCSVTVETFRGELLINLSGRDNIERICARLVELLQENDMDAYIADIYEYKPMKM